MSDDAHFITNIAALEKRYGETGVTSTAKEIDYLAEPYKQLIAASNFMALATVGDDGLDCSPRGDKGAVVRIVDDKTLMLPDRRGNNRIDSLRNIVRDPRVALLFLIKGSGTMMRVNGRAKISVEPDLLQSFAVEDHTPRSVVVITVERVYFQCARAVVRAGLWGDMPAPEDLPTIGAILQSLSAGAVEGAAYDEDWPRRAAKSMW